MSVDVNKFRNFTNFNSLCEDIQIEGDWPDNLAGCVFIVAPYHRKTDRHLFAGEGVIIKCDLQPQGGKVRVQRQKLNTWDSFWHSIQSPISEILPEAFFPARLGLIGVAEIANTGMVNFDGRPIMTADAGRYWEVDPISLETITPIGYFDEHIVSIPLSLFPLVANTAHPFYDPNTQELITCELKSTLRPGKLFTDMVSAVYITRWDGEGSLQHWELEGTVLDGSPHTAIVTEELIMIPDMPFQIGMATLLGIKFAPQQAYPKTQIYLVNRQDLKPDLQPVPSRLITFEGDSYHFLCDYKHDSNGKINLIAVQQATISVSEAIKPYDVKHFSGDRYTSEYHGIPWMFAFDPGVLRKVVIHNDAEYAQVVSQEAFIHPGWFSTMLHTADPRELFDPEGYSAIYQGYGGYHQDLICRRQYLSFRDHENRLLTDEQLPKHDLPSVLAKIPLAQNWQELTQQIKTEQKQNSDTPVFNLGKDLLDFYVCPDGYILDSIQFIPQQNKGYIFTTILGSQGSQVWLFDSENLSQGPIAKLVPPPTVNLGCTLHSDYFEQISPRKSDYNVDRWQCAVRSALKVPYEFLLNRRSDILNRKVN
jgi:carotenoid cleavage dioxygenase-like enzyme